MGRVYDGARSRHLSIGAIRLANPPAMEPMGNYVELLG
jgi:hypothetical protein